MNRDSKQRAVGAPGLAAGLALAAAGAARRSRRLTRRGKAVVVPGGGRGLGDAIATEFARRGGPLAPCRARPAHRPPPCPPAPWLPGAEAQAQSDEPALQALAQTAQAHAAQYRPLGVEPRGLSR